jgi:hypothetical protein
MPWKNELLLAESPAFDLQISIHAVIWEAEVPLKNVFFARVFEEFRGDLIGPHLSGDSCLPWLFLVHSPQLHGFRKLFAPKICRILA